MSTELQTIKDIARQSLMADFFGARVDEEGLWNNLQQLLAGIRSPGPNTPLDRIKQAAAKAATAVQFTDSIKDVNLWPPLKDLMSRIQVK
jgi:hypothetical protein